MVLYRLAELCIHAYEAFRLNTIKTWGPRTINIQARGARQVGYVGTIAWAEMGMLSVRF
jgi:hypothetical protein